jgi:PAS domain-containing protein
LSQLPDTHLLLDALLLGVTDEVYVLNMSSMQLVYVSDSAFKDTGYDLDSLIEHSIESLIGVSEEKLQRHLQSHSIINCGSWFYNQTSKLLC